MNRSGWTSPPESEDKSTGVERQTHRSQKTNLPESEDKSTDIATPRGQFRCLTVAPSPANGLREVSQIMVDKLVALPRGRIRERIGSADDGTLLALNRALAL